MLFCPGLLGKMLTNKRGIEFDLSSFEPIDVYADACLSKRMVLLTPEVWPLLLNLEIFAGSRFLQKSKCKQKRRGLSKFVSLVLIKTQMQII